MAIPDPTQGDRGSEEGDNFEHAIWNDRANAIAGLHHATDLQRGDLGQGSGNRCTDLSLLDLVVEALGSGDGFASSPFDFGDFVLQACDSAQTILFLRGEISHDPLSRGFRGSRLALSLFGLLSPSKRIQFAHKPALLQVGLPPGFFDSQIGASRYFLCLGERFRIGGFCASPLDIDCSLLGVQFIFERAQLLSRWGQFGHRLGTFKAFGVCVELEEEVTRFNTLPGDEMRGADAANDGCINRVIFAADLQSRDARGGVNGDAGLQ